MFCDKDSAKYQYLVTICANLLLLAYGASCGWPSAAGLILQSNETPLHTGPLSSDALSWVVSLFCLGGIVGTVLFGWIINYFGRKQILYFLAIPQIMSWIFIIIATEPIHLYVSRLLSGFSGGGGYVMMPIFVAEITEDRVRGALGSIITLSTNLGILLAFIASYYFAYTTVGEILLALPILFVVLFYIFPETPVYLMSKKKIQKAEQSLQCYRNVRRKSQQNLEYYRWELEKLNQHHSKKAQKSDIHQITLSDFTTVAARRAIVLVFILFTLNEFVGCFTLLNYSATIFAESGSNISPNLSAIIVAVIQLIGTYLSTILVERTGRRFLLIVSFVGCAVSNTVLSAYIYLNNVLGYDLQAYSWIAVVSFSACLFLGSIGIIPISYVMMTEVMPEKIRGVGTSFCLCYSWLLSFVTLKFFPILKDLIGMHVCILGFAFVAFIGIFYTIFWVLETKGKSFEEIQQKLEKNIK